MNRPASVEIAYKQRNWRLNQIITATEQDTDYKNDSNGILADVQNVARIIGPAHDPASEDLYVFTRSKSRSGHARPYRWRNLHAGATLKTGGGIDDTTQSMDVLESSDWPDRTVTQWYVGDTFKFEDGTDEILTITTITPGAPNDTWTVVRGDHGTSPSAHAVDVTIRKIRTSVPFIKHTLTRVLAGLPAPSDLVAAKIANGIRLTWNDNLSASEELELRMYRIYHDTDSGTLPADYPNVIEIAAPAEQSFDFYPGDDVTHYFRVANVDKTDQETALSNEANSVRGEFGDTAELDDRKPDVPLSAIRADGGTPGSWLMFISVAPSSAVGRSGIRKMQFQVAHTTAGWSAVSGFPGVIKYSSGLDADEVINGFQHYQLNREFPEASDDVGAYYLTARLYNEAGSVWSDWTDPTVSGAAFTVAGPPDATIPGTQNVSLSISNIPGAIGNAIKLNVNGPTDNGKAVYGVEVQLWSTLWPETTEHTLDLVNPSSEYTGDTVYGPDPTTNKKTIKSISPALTPGAEVDRVVYLYDSFNTNGEINNAESGLIEANTADEIDVYQQQTNGFKAAATGKKFRIADNWHSREGTYDHARFYSSLVPHPNAVSNTSGGQFFLTTDPITVSGTVYLRVRFVNAIGAGPWVYWNSTGPKHAGDRTAAEAFTVGKVGTDAIELLAITEDLLADGAVAGIKSKPGTMPANSTLEVTPKSGDEQDSAEWDGGTVYWGDQTSESFNASSVSNLTVGFQYFLYKVVGNANLAISSDPTDAFGDDRFPLAILTPTAVSGEQIGIAHYNSTGLNNFSADMIGVGKLAAITADMGILTAGEVRTALFRTGTGPQMVKIDGTGGVHKFEVIDSSAITRIDMTTALDAINFYDATGALSGSWGGSAGGGLRANSPIGGGGIFSAGFDADKFANMYFSVDRDGVGGQGEIEFALWDGVVQLSTVTLATTGTTFDAPVSMSSNAAIAALIGGGGRLHATKGGTAPAISSNTLATFMNAAAAGSNAQVSIVSGASGTAVLALGDTGDEDRCKISYIQAADVLAFTIAGSQIPLLFSPTTMTFGGNITTVNMSSDVVTFRDLADNTEMGSAPTTAAISTVSIKPNFADDIALMVEAHASQSVQAFKVGPSGMASTWLGVGSDGGVTIGTATSLGASTLNVTGSVQMGATPTTLSTLSIKHNAATKSVFLEAHASQSTALLKAGPSGLGTTWLGVQSDGGVTIGNATSLGAGTLTVATQAVVGATAVASVGGTLVASQSFLIQYNSANAPYLKITTQSSGGHLINSGKVGSATAQDIIFQIDGVSYWGITQFATATQTRQWFPSGSLAHYFQASGATTTVFWAPGSTDTIPLAIGDSTALSWKSIAMAAKDSFKLHLAGSSSAQLTLTSTTLTIGTTAGAVTSIVPGKDNFTTLGTGSKRWSDVQSVLINGADIGFASGWRLREYGATERDLGRSSQWFRKHANGGIQLMDETGRILFVLHRDGNIYTDGSIRPLKELFDGKDRLK